jgi:alpha-amylase
MRIQKRLLLLLFTALLFYTNSPASPWNGKVILQGFWWDYWNNNYPNDWATYLAKLAPRLREMGIDAVWIPPTVKNNTTSSVGYSPFDHYDLGDKYQKGSTTTRFGNKDKFLRAVAILHANGLDVIQDVVWNHLANAGSVNGSGGLDPEAWSNQYKNFRYSSYATPAGNESALDYYSRAGRFPKNWQNFHPNSAHNSEADDWTAGYWGPDLCYYTDAYGESSNCTYNPLQSPDYIRDGMRDWNIWMKKQTGVDGYRIDASKHLPYWASKDFIYNLAYNAGWASGGAEMIAIGEYVGGKAELDAWVDNVNYSNGYTDVVGTFDFSFRGAVYNMVYGQGNFDISTIPAAQQDRRSRTVPFVNNHDTFRPVPDVNGNYNTWDTGNELAAHIDPREPRIEAAYAVTFAVDGTPQIFFEDLFDIGTTGMRWSHEPDNAAELPARDFLTNQLWCYQNLNFKDGAYNVRWQTQDLLIIEREGKAIIAINDNYNTWQSATIQTAFGANVQLHDYSGANSNDIWTDASGQATIWVPPCDGSNIRRGYSIYGPANVSGGYEPTPRGTTQEWEMADDLGDSHVQSLGQGGQLPAFSTDQRFVGRVWSAAGTPVSIDIYPDDSGQSYTVDLYGYTGSHLATRTASGVSNISYTPASEHWLDIRIRNSDGNQSGQTVWVKVTYTGPQMINLNDSPLPVMLSHFSVDASRTFPFIQWVVESELNTAQYEIQRTDLNFHTSQSILSAAAAGNSSARRSYSRTDSSALPNRRYRYQLFSVDLDGSREEVAAREIQTGVPEHFRLIGNFPNPFNPVTTIRFDLQDASGIELELFSASGESVLREYQNFLPGRAEWRINLAGFSSGTYFYRLINSGNRKELRGKLLLLK